MKLKVKNVCQQNSDLKSSYRRTAGRRRTGTAAG
jgi:hypothetical protein